MKLRSNSKSNVVARIETVTIMLKSYNFLTFIILFHR